MIDFKKLGRYIPFDPVVKDEIRQIFDSSGWDSHIRGLIYTQKANDDFFSELEDRAGKRVIVIVGKGHSRVLAKSNLIDDEDDYNEAWNQVLTALGHEESNRWIGDRPEPEDDFFADCEEQDFFADCEGQEEDFDFDDDEEFSFEDL